MRALIAFVSILVLLTVGIVLAQAGRSGTANAAITAPADPVSTAATGGLVTPSTTSVPPAGSAGQDVIYDRFAKKAVSMKEDDLRKNLTPLQFEVTRREGTEYPYANEYWDNHAPGIYVDLISGEPLFSSTDKYDSGTGWPSFTKPINAAAVKENGDTSLGMVRIKLKSLSSGSHLGHVFDDGPAPAGLRYCMNSAALRFIPLDKMKEAGYGDYLKLFDARS